MFHHSSYLQVKLYIFSQVRSRKCLSTAVFLLSGLWFSIHFPQHSVWLVSSPYAMKSVVMFSLFVSCCSGMSAFSKKQSLKLEIVLDDSGHVLRRRAGKEARWDRGKRYVFAHLWACKGHLKATQAPLCPQYAAASLPPHHDPGQPCRTMPPFSACLSVVSGGDCSFKCRSLLFPFTGAFYQ